MHHLTNDRCLQVRSNAVLLPLLCWGGASSHATSQPPLCWVALCWGIVNTGVAGRMLRLLLGSALWGLLGHRAACLVVYPLLLSPVVMHPLDGLSHALQASSLSGKASATACHSAKVQVMGT